MTEHAQHAEWCWGSHHSDGSGVAQGNFSRRRPGSGPPATTGSTVAMMATTWFSPGLGAKMGLPAVPVREPSARTPARPVRTSTCTGRLRAEPKRMSRRTWALIRMARADMTLHPAPPGWVRAGAASLAQTILHPLATPTPTCLVQRDAKQHRASCWFPTNINTNIAGRDGAPFGKNRTTPSSGRDAL